LKPIVDPNSDASKVPHNYNGGLFAGRMSRLQKGDRLFRFSNSDKRTLEERFEGDWWFDWECLATIRAASRIENADFAATARSFLGMLWGDKTNLVGGLLTADFWCLKGLTGAFGDQQQHMSGPPRTDVMQIYVPGGLKLAYFSQPRDNLLISGIV